MENSKTKQRQRKTKGKKRSKVGYNQQPSGAYVYRPAIGPTRALKMPAEFSVALVNTDYDSFTTASSYTVRRFGIVEFLSYRPLYCLELYQIWKYVRVTSVTIEIRVVNTSTTVPLVAALGQCPYSDSSGLTPDRAWETPGTVRKLVSVQGGMDKCVLKKTFVGQNCYGQPYLDQKYWIDVSQSASATPVDQNEPVGYYVISDYSGSGGFSCKVEFKTTYHCQFFDLRIPSSSLNDCESIDDSDQQMSIAKKYVVKDVPANLKRKVF